MRYRLRTLMIVAIVTPAVLFVAWRVLGFIIGEVIFGRGLGNMPS